MSRSAPLSVLATFIALCGITVTAPASAQQQPAAPASQQQSSSIASVVAVSAEHAGDDAGAHGATATKAVAAPVRVAPTRTPDAPNAPEAGCIGPASFCNVYFGS
ncbi:DUF4148 domain-containing protein [Burkholderia vietnamiensis]|jgi:hypothetical protein|uniref:DUF4148 domain-containing protein n=1 Tax=Burkholderia vietnamiensis TaxID=60552 RepID=UPI001CB1A375|nr:DUF4148 domain-containing protein [Burkholderia vietnamiensis]CAG9212461.1 conserved exported hypothetical protein [Burkholderia vietnamiensis]HDR9202946.1 DUF4148 domain-containing protein [Burkholderia vietnamiensis]